MTDPTTPTHTHTPDASTPTTTEPHRTWQRYVAIGDSFTEGMSDLDPSDPSGDAYRGWADVLAGHLSARAAAAGVDFGYANLAVRGRKLDDIVGQQLDAALELSPDLVSMVGGGNDILRPKVDLDALAARLESAVERIRATGADVLLATPADPAEAGLPSSLRGRHGIHTANLFSIAQRHGCHVLNLWQRAALRDWSQWAEDRIHLTTEGHRRVAHAAAQALGVEGVDEAWLTRPDAPTAGRRIDELREHGAWVRTHVAPWVQRRVTGRSSGDGRTPKRPTLAPVQPAPLP